MKAHALRTARRRRQSGVAMIIVLWLVAFLSLVIFTAVKVVKNDTDVMISQKKSFRATQLAEMGIAIGANPATEEKDFDLLNRNFDGVEGYSVQFRGEGGKLNINYVLAAQDRELLKYIFGQWGMEDEIMISELIDALIDWTDGDALRSTNGAEIEYYEELGFTNYPFNRPFYSLDEMPLVRGMEYLIMLKPNWRDYFTIYSANRLDINEADPELIALVARVDLRYALDLAEFRLGLDQIDGTEDDRQLQSMADVSPLLNVPPDDIALSQRITFNDETTRIESIGWIGDFRKKIVVVVRNRSNRPQILIREEVPLF